MVHNHFNIFSCIFLTMSSCLLFQMKFRINLTSSSHQFNIPLRPCWTYKLLGECLFSVSQYLGAWVSNARVQICCLLFVTLGKLLAPSQLQFLPLNCELREGKVMVPSFTVSLQCGTKWILNKYLLIMNKWLDESIYNPSGNILRTIILRL